MTFPTHRSVTSPGSNDRGFTLIEMLITMAITTVILGATMVAMRTTPRARRKPPRRWPT